VTSSTIQVVLNVESEYGMTVDWYGVCMHMYLTREVHPVLPGSPGLHGQRSRTGG
jgi:hypothetical protein